MVFKRKRAPARAGMRKRRRFGVRRVPRPLRSLQTRPAVLNVKRVYYSGFWTFGTGTTDGFWRYAVYNLAQLPNVSEYQALFDEYKINAIKVTFRPRYDNVASDSAAGGTPQAYAHYFIDPASTVTPSGTYSQANLNTFLENSGVRTATLNRPFSVYFKPKVQTLASSTAATPVAAVQKGTWMKTSEPAVLYRGFHIYLQQNAMYTTNGNISLDMFVTYYMTFKNLK